MAGDNPEDDREEEERKKRALELSDEIARKYSADRLTNIMVAGAGQGVMGELCIRAHQGHRRRPGMLVGGKLEETPRKFRPWVRSIGGDLKVVGVVELLVIGQPEEAHEHEPALDHNGHGRGDEVRPITRDDEVHLIDIE